MYIDTHAHLNFEKFKDDWAEAVDRSFDSNIGAIIIPSSNLETSIKALEIAKHYDKGVYAAIGLHPIHVKEEEFDSAAFEKLIKNPKVVAVGETGLDYYYDRTSKEQQKELFRKHLNLAQKYAKPMIFHSRDAGEDVLSLLMEEKNDFSGVMHCYQGNWQFAKVLLDMGLYLSFTGLITFTKNSNTLEVLQKVPLDRLMIETDCPYMTPEPYRGQRNEPAFIAEVAKKIAEIKKISAEEVAEQTSKNAIGLFNLKLEEDTLEV